MTTIFGYWRCDERTYNKDLQICLTRKCRNGKQAKARALTLSARRRGAKFREGRLIDVHFYGIGAVEGNGLTKDFPHLPDKKMPKREIGKATRF
jgi:hypothetical protein